jgi:hypothetical protein
MKSYEQRVHGSLLVLVLACTAEPDSTTSKDSDETVTVEELEPLSISAQDGMDGVQQILESRPFSMDVLIDSYLWLMSEGDSSCPGGGTDLTGLVPVEGCTSESGLTYLGVSTFIDLTQEIEGEGLISGFILNADLEIIDAEGHSYEGGASRRYTRRTSVQS